MSSHTFAVSFQQKGGTLEHVQSTQANVSLVEHVHAGGIWPPTTSSGCVSGAQFHTIAVRVFFFFSGVMQTCLLNSWDWTYSESPSSKPSIKRHAGWSWQHIHITLLRSGFLIVKLEVPFILATQPKGSRNEMQLRWSAFQWIIPC